MLPEGAASLQSPDGIMGMDLVAPTDYDAVEADENLELVERLSYNTLYLAVNPLSVPDSPLQELAVRQAVAHAINKAALIDPFYGGRGAPADIFMPPTSGWYDAVGADVPTYEFNEETARQLLADAGFGPENPPTVQFWYPTEVTRPYMPDPAGIGQAIITMLENVGFVVEPNSSVWGTEYIPARGAGQLPMYLLGWIGDFGDPDNFVGTFFQTEQPAAEMMTVRAPASRSTRTASSRSRRCRRQADGLALLDPRHAHPTLPRRTLPLPQRPRRPGRESAPDHRRPVVKVRRRCLARNEDDRRPVYGDTRKFQDDPHWRDHVLFYEYFHGDTGAGLGAAHQTGWTALVAGVCSLIFGVDVGYSGLASGLQDVLGIAIFILVLIFAFGVLVTVWPPSGIALASLLLRGPRVWPGIALGAFLAHKWRTWLTRRPV